MLDKSENKLTNNNFRNYGVDALRIISMLMIVMLHVLKFGGFMELSSSTNYWILWFLEVSAFCAVDCYALISGYVAVYSKFKLSNLVFLWCRVSFYSVLISVIFKIFFPSEISNGLLVYSFFPVISHQYWYFTAYSLAFLFFPFLNEGINRLSKKQLRLLLVVIISLASFLKPLIAHFWGDVFVLNEGFSPWWLMILYVIGAYTRKYGFLRRAQSFRSIIFLGMYFAFVLLTWLSKLFIHYCINHIGSEMIDEECLLNYQSITILGSAVSLLLAFEQLKFHKCVIRMIAAFSPLAFSVYLIHDNSLIRQKFLLEKFIWIAKLPVYQMVLLVFGIVIGIFLVCSLLDLIRVFLFKKLKIKERLRSLELKILK